MTATVAALAIASIVAAQVSSQGRFAGSQGDRPITLVQQMDAVFVAPDEVVPLLGGTLARESTGYRITLGGRESAFGLESQFGVVSDELFEMPARPMTLEGRPFVPWQFLRQVVRVSIEQDLTFDPSSRLLRLQPLVREALAVQVSLVDLEQSSKLVLQLSAKPEYQIEKQESGYLVRFKNALRPPFAEQEYESLHVAKIVFREREIVIELRSPDVVGDSYALESPERLVFDFQRGLAGDVPLHPDSSRKPLDLPGIRTIVLDPGHGGKEVGAIGPNGLMEKDATLAICRKLAELIPRVLKARVILTRTEDSVIPLGERTALANRYKADLFLSVHLNAALNKGANGPETYFLSVDATDEQAREAAERENLESIPSATAHSSDLRLILWDLAQQENLKESSRFAELIQSELNGVSKVEGRGVKQAPFKVLVGAAMPAALVEVAFISNPDEESKLRSDEFQLEVASGLLRAIQAFKSEFDTRSGLTAPAAASRPAQPPPASAATETRNSAGVQ